MKYNELHNMDPHEFELLVGQAFAALGYNVLVTSQTSDGGVDLIVDKYDQNLAQWMRNVVQVKRYKSTIGIEKVRELNGVLDVHHASCGCLLTLSGFKRGVRQRVHADFPRISLLDGNRFRELLRTAGLLDLEDNVISATDSNAERNRRFAILKVLRESQPTPLSDAEIIGKVRSNCFVTVPDLKLKEDVSALQEAGNIIVIDGRNYCAPKQSEIQIALNGLTKILQTVDYFVSDTIACRILEDHFSISRDIWSDYFNTQVVHTLDRLATHGQLHAVGNGLYATPSAIEQFRTSKLDSRLMKTNIENILKIDDETRSRPIKDTQFYPEPGHGKLITGADEESRKLMPFLKVLCWRCPECSSLHIAIVELISLYVTSSEIDSKMEGLDEESPLQKRAEGISKRFLMSRLFVERMSTSFEKYFGGIRGTTLSFQNQPVAGLHIKLDIREDESLDVLRDRILEVSERYQSFLNEVYAPIEDFGRPRSASILGDWVTEVRLNGSVGDVEME